MKSWLKFERKYNQIITNLSSKSTKNQLFFNEISTKFLYYPLLKIHRKSLKIDNKFIKNQWKSMKYLSKISWKSSEIDYNLTSNWPHFYLKSWPKWTTFWIMDLTWGVMIFMHQKWDNIWNNGFPIRGHHHV